MHRFIRADTGDPLILPRPKNAIFTKNAGPFRITRKTHILQTDNRQGSRKAALLLQNAIKAAGLFLPIITKRQSFSDIYVGVQGSREMVDRYSSGPGHKEGYKLHVSDELLICVGTDEAGILWGVQTLLQLLQKDATSLFVPAAYVEDWPSLSLRAVHLFHGQNALPFHQKLIDRVLSPYKMNALFIQAEQVRWNADPQVAPDWAGSKSDIAREIAYAKTRGLTVYPLLESYGHMEWLFKKSGNEAFAEDPQTPYAVNFTDPKAVGYLEKFNAEADALFDAPGFHVGLDEVTMRGRFPYQSLPLTFSELLIKSATHWRDFFKKRGKDMWMWADMALHPTEVAPCFGTAPSPEAAARVRASLPKDIIMVDWQYTARPNYPSLDLLKKSGFTRRVAATWHDRAGIQNFARAAKANGALGVIQTTWAGYESSEKVLSTPERKQFTAMIAAADYFWNGGDGPAPDKLPYDIDAVFAANWK